MLLRLGKVDEDVSLSEAERRIFFKRYHHPGGFPSRFFTRFRDDNRKVWRGLEPQEGEPVRELTRFLQQAGFMPHASHDGIFGYVTEAAVRLFQEYVRTNDPGYAEHEEEHPSFPDGVVGRDTRFHLERWKRDQLTARWGAADRFTADHKRWTAWLLEARKHYIQSPSVTMKKVIDLPMNSTDTLIPDHWQFPTNQPLLVGIRHGAEQSVPLGGRPNDDLFTLLVNGMTFHFWGSTDSKPRKKKEKEAFLVEGQHLYGFSWHNLSTSRQHKIYQAMRPARLGVLVTRDVNETNALDAGNRADGFDKRGNHTINIHWTGDGRSNWSAGCQVISGRSYVNDAGEVIDCSDFAAVGSADLGSVGRSGARMTKGAYHLLADLLLCYAIPTEIDDIPVIRYTLLQDKDLETIPGLDRQTLHEQLTAMKKT